MSARGGKPDSPGNAPKLELWFKSTAGSGILENPFRELTFIASLTAGERLPHRRNNTPIQACQRAPTTDASRSHVAMGT